MTVRVDAVVVAKVEVPVAANKVVVALVATRFVVVTPVEEAFVITEFVTYKFVAVSPVVEALVMFAKVE